MSIRSFLTRPIDTKTAFSGVVVALFAVFVVQAYVTHVEVARSQSDTTNEEPVFDQEGVLEGSDDTLSSLLLFDLEDFDPTVLFLSYLWPPEGLVGAEVTLSGGGFTEKQNTIHFGGVVIENKESRTKSDLVFTVPDVQFGRHTIFVTNENGTTSNAVTFNVLNPNREAPIITEIIPSSAKAGDTVTIHGFGFAPANNRIYAGDMEFENVPSPDGTTLTFIVESLIEEDDLRTVSGAEEEELRSREYTGEISTIEAEPLWIYVENEGGLSNYGLLHRVFEDHDDMVEMME